MADLVIEDRLADDPAVRELAAAAAAELAGRYRDDDTAPYPLAAGIRFVVALLSGEPVGCGALQPIDATTVEVKRMYVRPGERGRGVSRRILAALEERATTAGYPVVQLETGIRQPEAIGLYETSGYERIPAYGPYIGDAFSVCFRKRLRSVHQ